jgi:hypothetical protein
MDTWDDLARRFRELAGNDVHRLNDRTLSEICAFMSSTYSAMFKPSDTGAHAVYLQRRDGSYPSKQLKVEAITNNRLEFCLSDRDTGISHNFMPHADHATGLERFKSILAGIDWSAPVKPDRRRWF